MLLDAGCVAVEAGPENHDAMDAYGKKNNLTVVFAAWHPRPEYRIFKTGSLFSKNEDYPSGLVLVSEQGNPSRYKKEAPNVA